MNTSSATNTFSTPATATEPFDVVVIGGGTTGACAALAAARNGAKTALVEYYGFLGGTAVMGLPWLGFHDKKRRLVVKGIAYEMIERMSKTGDASPFHYDPICNSATWINDGGLKVLLAEMTREANVHLYLHTLAAGVKKTDGKVEGLYAMSKQGCHYLPAKVVIDCTDSGDVAVMSGAEAEFGRSGDGKVQAASLMMRIAGVDLKETIAFFRKYPDQMRPWKLEGDILTELLGSLDKTNVFVMGALPELVEKARQEGLNMPRDRIIGTVNPQQGLMALVSTRIENANPNDVESMTSAELRGLEQVQTIMRFVREYFPGGRNAWLVDLGHQIGIRETRHTRGEYCLTADDLMSGKQFDDAIGLGGYHLDIHSPDHKGLAGLRKPPVYSIPFRCLLPKGTKNVLVAGRAISASHEAMSSTRVIPICATQGEAAGTAAALAIRQGKELRELDMQELRKILQAQGAELGQGLQDAE